MEDIIASALQSDTCKYKSIYVDRDLEPIFDLGNLLATDPNVADIKKLRENKEDYFKSLARDNTQLLVNKIWDLPCEKLDGVLLAKLPLSTTVLPREKVIPKVKPPTKWEQYAKTRGVQNRKRSKLIWDEETKAWKPRWGYRRDAVDEKKDWMIEVPATADPYEDQFAKQKKEKDERVAKNELQRLRNIARAKKIPIPGVGIVPTEHPQKEQVTKARHLARASTASMGKFTEMLPKEKPLRKTGKKRKFEPLTGDMNKEKDAALGILEKIHNKKPKVNVEVALRAKKNPLLQNKDDDSDDGGGKSQKPRAGKRKGPMSKSKQKIRGRGPSGPKKRRVSGGGDVGGNKMKRRRQGGKRR